jgi:hypothetical protein
MKFGLLLLMFLLLAMCLPALDVTTNDYIDLTLLTGEFFEFESESYLVISGSFFISKQLYLEELPTQEEAVDYLASTGLLFAVVQENLADYESTSETDKMKEVEYIACPYKSSITDISMLAVMELKYILDAFDSSVMSTNNEAQQFELCKQIVTNKYSKSRLSLYFDVEE